MPSRWFHAGRRLGGVALAAASFMLLTASSPQGLQTQIDCEEAVQQLADCCPGFDPQSLYCAYDGCDNRTPDLTIADSQEILSLDCDQLRAGGYCTRRYDGTTSGAAGSAP